MKLSYDILLALLQTEKSTLSEPEGKYLFLVRNDANKTEIKRSVEEIYKVKVKNVNTLVETGKSKRVRYQLGRTPDTKKAIVTLKKGEKITIS
ncbi:MAG: 50S ribosomal protein L23 [Candidatus Omnitrophota bacterium]|jgi:large subunit ribosomal protein L23|nr:MAG: 50S ribosomal protein L23 [Candidatus Omnitrophota bacterium]